VSRVENRERPPKLSENEGGQALRAEEEVRGPERRADDDGRRGWEGHWSD
jgi:hypothetical protein